MKIDTTATILQLSQLLAASAGVGGAVVVAGDASTPQQAVATAQQGAGQPAASFLQLLTQIQQAATAEANPASPTPPDTKTADAAPASDDNSSDPTSISNALLALLSQSNQPLPTNAPVPATTEASTPAKPGDVAVSAVSSGCPALAKPEAIIATGGSDVPPKTAPAGDAKLQPIDIKSDQTPAPTDSTLGIDISGLEAVQANPAVPQVAAPAIPSVQPPSTDSKVAATEINPIAETKPAANTIEVAQPQPAATNSLNNEVPQAPPADAVTQVASRHTEIQPIEIKTPEVDRIRSAADSVAAFRVVSDAPVEVSGDIEPVESSSETVEVDDATHADALDVNISGESVHGSTELPSAIDPSSPPTTVDAHSLAHHLQEMVTQLSKSDSPDHASVVLRLDPPELGRVNVHMTMSNDVVSIRMVASDDAARQVIERQLNDLQQSLNNQGISFQDCQVQVGGSGQQSSDRGMRKQWADNSGYSAFSGRRAAVTSASTQVRTANLAQLDYVA